jgi:hypothetical protein
MKTIVIIILVKIKTRGYEGFFYAVRPLSGRKFIADYFCAGDRRTKAE